MLDDSCTTGSYTGAVYLRIIMVLNSLARCPRFGHRGATVLWRLADSLYKLERKC
jgi:hypothetical protein